MLITGSPEPTSPAIGGGKRKLAVSWTHDRQSPAQEGSNRRLFGACSVNGNGAGFVSSGSGTDALSEVGVGIAHPEKIAPRDVDSVGKHYEVQSAGVVAEGYEADE